MITVKYPNESGWFLKILENHYLKFITRPSDIYRPNIFFLTKPTLGEALLLSWLYYSIYCFLSLSIIVFLSSGVLNQLFNDSFLMELSFDYFFRYRALIFFGSIFFFPIGRLIVYFYLKAISGVLSPHVSSIVKKNMNPLIHYFYADIFYIIPIFGPLIRFFAAIYYLFVSLTKGLGLSRSQFYITLVGPFVLLSILSFLLFGAMIFLLAMDIS